MSLDLQPEYTKVGDRLPTPAAHRNVAVKGASEAAEAPARSASKMAGGGEGGGPSHSSRQARDQDLNNSSFPISSDEPAINIQQLVTNNPATWGDALRSYEYLKRRVIHPGHLTCDRLKIPAGIMKEKERVFNPILQVGL